MERLGYGAEALRPPRNFQTVGGGSAASTDGNANASYEVF